MRCQCWGHWLGTSWPGPRSRPPSPSPARPPCPGPSSRYPGGPSRPGNYNNAFSLRRLVLNVRPHLQQRTAAGLTLGEVLTERVPAVRDDLADVVLAAAHPVQARHCHGERLNLLEVKLHHQVSWEILSATNN